jgi:arylsulfatase A-like enzyme
VEALLSRTLGYRTHAVGKWHLGFCKWEYTPTYRYFLTNQYVQLEHI